MGGRRGGREVGVKNVFPYPNELLIWVYPENLVEIRLMVEVLDTFCGTGSPWAWAQGWLSQTL